MVSGPPSFSLFSLQSFLQIHLIQYIKTKTKTEIYLKNLNHFRTVKEDTDVSLYPSQGRDASLMAGRIYSRKVRFEIFTHFERMSCFSL